MKAIRIFAILVAMNMSYLNLAQADCNGIYSRSVEQLKSAQENYQGGGLALAALGIFTGAYNASHGDTLGKVMLVGGIGGGIAIATLGTVINSPKDLQSAVKLIDESQKGTGLMVQMLKSDLKRKGLALTDAQIASKVTEYNQKEILCPQTADGHAALGYTAIRQLLLSADLR